MSLLLGPPLRRRIANAFQTVIAVTIVSNRSGAICRRYSLIKADESGTHEETWEFDK
jgi:hypothetical protein